LSFSEEGEEQGGEKDMEKENGNGNKVVEREAITAGDKIEDSEGERKLRREGGEGRKEGSDGDKSEGRKGWR
jgi:hypothetical protein